MNFPPTVKGDLLPAQDRLEPLVDEREGVLLLLKQTARAAQAGVWSVKGEPRCHPLFR